MLYARVATSAKKADVDMLLDYQLSPLSGAPGNRVLVPLGNRKVEGIIVQVVSHTDVEKIKSVEKILDDTRLEPPMMDLAHWLTERAGCSLAAVLFAMLPPRRKPLPMGLKLAAPPGELPAKQLAVARLMSDGVARTKAEISRELGISSSPVDALAAKDILVKAPLATSVDFPGWELDVVEYLTARQDQVLTDILQATDNLARPGNFLLHGVAGSGKTEVYIRLTQQALASQGQVLMLVPEIALTAQLVARFRAAFGEKVAVLHSGLEDRVRADFWRGIAKGDFPVVVGTRSAVFAPLTRLRLVVLDEEHEPAYKQEETPRYHARDVALYRAKKEQATLLMGSATPSLESMYQAKKGNFQLLKLPERIFRRHLETSLVDMREELQAGNRSVVSRELRDSLDQTLARGEQAILFLNRRGLAPTVLCRNCGFRYTCSQCSTGLTLHSSNLLRCHYCDRSIVLSKTCPQCGSSYLKKLGQGTQKLEEVLSEFYPGHSVLRLDSDSAASALARERLLQRFYRCEANILVGTQMIAKGLDFPNVTLVGVILADLSLAMADFRSAERTFQLVTQAAGRAGRAEKQGRVIIQTYQPEHYSLRFALEEDYEGFYAYETKLRQRAGLPPYSKLARIVISSPRQQNLQRQKDHIIEELTSLSDWEIIYSGSPPFEMLKGSYRWHILLRQPQCRQDFSRLNEIRQQVKKVAEVRVMFDYNPVNLM